VYEYKNNQHNQTKPLSHTQNTEVEHHTTIHDLTYKTIEKEFSLVYVRVKYLIENKG
jgi:hypothetical protein